MFEVKIDYAITARQQSSVVSVCHSVCPFLAGTPKWPLPMMPLVTWNHPRHGPSPSHPHGNLTIQGPDPSPWPSIYIGSSPYKNPPGYVQTCSLWSMNCLQARGCHLTEMPSCLYCYFFAVCTEGYTQSSGSCGECLKGSYKNGTGNHACLLCPAGTYNNASGQTSCTSCESGFYSPEPGLEQCLSCSGNVNDQNTDCGK